VACLSKNLGCPLEYFGPGEADLAWAKFFAKKKKKKMLNPKGLTPLLPSPL